MSCFFLMIRRPPISTQSRSSAASDVYKRQLSDRRAQWQECHPQVARTRRQGQDERIRTCPPQPSYGDGVYASPSKPVACSRDTSFQHSSQPDGRAHYHEAEMKYLPTHREAVTGYHYPVPAYGHGHHAEPLQQQNGYAACLLYTSPSPRDRTRSRMPSSA
eukprot:TRINITY_DN10291_c0_g1_i1.p1 TRINITY_DN10291_c0_g1~~TRINITY_DN10291_c0_g1_i1.p1  ORF type:complete len:161 (-),score=58.47 TRINITY_DN10291_c0_g1_i1:66-548(-)